MYDLCINVNEVKIQKHSQELRSDYRKELMQTDFPQNVFVKLRYVVFNQRQDLSPLLFLWREENCHAELFNRTLHGSSNGNRRQGGTITRPWQCWLSSCSELEKCPLLECWRQSQGEWTVLYCPTRTHYLNNESFPHACTCSLSLCQYCLSREHIKWKTSEEKSAGRTDDRKVFPWHTSLHAKPWSTSQAQSDKDYLRLKFNKGPVSLSLCKLAKLKFLLNALLPLCCECLACVASGHWLSLGRGAIGQRVLKIQRMHAPKHPVRTHCWKEPHRGQQYAWT